MGASEGVVNAGRALGERLSRAVATTTPLELVSGSGAELVAADGERFLDFISGYGVTNTGHCHPRVVAAIQAQAETLVHVSTSGTPRSRAATRSASATSSRYRAPSSSTGTAAPRRWRRR